MISYVKMIVENDIGLNIKLEVEKEVGSEFEVKSITKITLEYSGNCRTRAESDNNISSGTIPRLEDYVSSYIRQSKKDKSVASRGKGRIGKEMENKVGSIDKSSIRNSRRDHNI